MRQPRTVEEAARNWEQALIETKWIGLGLLFGLAPLLIIIASIRSCT